MSIFKIGKIDIFEDKCLSQDLSCILHNTVEGSGVDVSRGGSYPYHASDLPACLSASRVTTPRQTQNVDTMLAL